MGLVLGNLRAVSSKLLLRANSRICSTTWSAVRSVESIDARPRPATSGEIFLSASSWSRLEISEACLSSVDGRPCCWFCSQPAPRALFGVRLQKDLERRVGKNHGPDVAAFHHHPAALQPAIVAERSVSCGLPAGARRATRRASLPGVRISAVTSFPSSSTCGCGWPGTNRISAEATTRPTAILIVRRDAGLQHLERRGAVGGAAVHVGQGPGAAASIRATVLFPAPAGPSMVMTRGSVMFSLSASAVILRSPGRDVEGSEFARAHPVLRALSSLLTQSSQASPCPPC